jgi:hypothetical protein
MLRNYSVVFDSKGVISRLQDLGPEVERAAARAVSGAAVKARTLSARKVRQEVNFPASYVAPAEGRLAVRYKSGDPLEARIVARSRATSLARFAMTRRTGGGVEPGVRVQVKPGVARFMRGAFLVKLKGVGGDMDTQANLGLAARTKNGEAPNNAYRPAKTRKGYWLLYGPSVAQALLSASGEKGIWPDLTTEIRNYFESEFFRQLELD